MKEDDRVIHTCSSTIALTPAWSVLVSIVEARRIRPFSAVRDRGVAGLGGGTSGVPVGCSSGIPLMTKHICTDLRREQTIGCKKDKRRAKMIKSGRTFHSWSWHGSPPTTTSRPSTFRTANRSRHCTRTSSFGHGRTPNTQS